MFCRNCCGISGTAYLLLMLMYQFAIRVALELRDLI
uniref:DnaJ-like protein n=1 Tax=Rhizophora mucronata TaxID=61149 RepID=A0A2P2M7I0_RHIMU